MRRILLCIAEFSCSQQSEIAQVSEWPTQQYGNKPMGEHDGMFRFEKQMKRE